MNLKEIDDQIWDMSNFEKSNILHYLVGFAKSDKEFGNQLEKILSEKFEGSK